MAALELGVLNYFAVIFPALLVFVIVFAILEKTEFLGKSKILNSALAVAAMFMVLVSKEIIQIINFGAPWFVLVFVFLILLLLIYRFMGASEEDLTAAVKDKAVYWTILVIGLIIIISSISNIYGQRLLEQAPGEGVEGAEGIDVTAEEREGISYRSEIYETLFDPKILGMVLIFLIATFTVALLTKEGV